MLEAAAHLKVYAHVPQAATLPAELAADPTHVRGPGLERHDDGRLLPLTGGMKGAELLEGSVDARQPGPGHQS